jgi:hypothetical protein
MKCGNSCLRLLEIGRNVMTGSSNCVCDIDIEKCQRQFNPVFADGTLSCVRETSFAEQMETYNNPALTSSDDENRRDVVIYFNFKDTLLIQPSGQILKPLLSQHHLQS